jgi:hypothetical protein
MRIQITYFSQVLNRFLVYEIKNYEALMKWLVDK